MDNRHYSDAQAREILRRAVEKEAEEDAKLHHRDLVAAASELGIPEELVDQAVEEYERERELNDELETMASERRRRLASSISTWAITNALLFGIDYATGGGYWFYWPLMSWGFIVALQTKSTFLRNRDKDVRQAQKRIAKRRRKNQAKARAHRHAQRERSGEKEFEASIEQGVDALLRIAARGMAHAGEAMRASLEDLDGVARRRVRVDTPTREAEGTPSAHQERERTKRVER